MNTMELNSIKNDEPLVSVIMGVYNPKRINLLKKSIDSILNQSYRNLEFIICNDCSTDDVVQTILQEYIDNDSRVKVINNKENYGLAKSLNNCIEVSKGLYIARQDDDDISMPNRLKIEIDYLESHPNIALVGCNLILFNDDGEWGKRDHKEFPQKRDFLRKSQFAHPATIIRKNVLNRIGNYAVSKLTRRSQDYELYMRLYYYDYIGANIQEYLYLYFEDETTYKNRKFKYRLDEYHFRKYWFRKLGLMPEGYLYALIPIISGITPIFIKRFIKRIKYGR